MAKSIWQMIADKLIENGIDVYPPATHQGECLSKYVVLKEDGASQFQQFSTKIRYYTLLCYVPKNSYTELSSYTQQCRNIMAQIAPLIMPTGYETPDFYDDSIKGHMTSIQYRNYVRDELL